jgi:polysaccharide biosynthesis/export protein
MVRTHALSRTYRTLSLAIALLIVAFIGASARAADAQADVPPPPPRADYIIGPGDMLQVFVWRNPELSSTVPVRPDGKISTPLVEDMVAVGKSPAQLARDVERVLAEYVRSPTVNVIVATAASALSQIKVIGQVKVPQSVPYRDGLRVLDVILIAGGVTDFAAANRAKVVRAAVNNGKPKEERVKLGNLLEKGDMKQNLLLGPGDALVVPQARF